MLKLGAVLRAVSAALLLQFAATGASAYSVSDTGQILNAQGKEIRLSGVNWFGFETSEATVHGIWSVNWKSMIAQMKSVGFNAVRLPFCPRTLQGVTPTGINSYENPDLVGLNSLQLMDKIIQYMSDQGFYILLDHHRPDCNAISELPTVSGYTETQWINDLKFVANRYKTVSGVIGIDLKNEPHGVATWSDSKPATDWNKMAERASAGVLSVAPDLLVFVEGVGGQPGNACSDNRNYWWGGNITPIKCYPLDIPRNRLVLSPHVYGPDVFMQPYFSDANFPNNMPEIWDAHFGFAAGLNYAIAFGEFGGKYGKGEPKDKIWQDKFVSYMIEKRMTNFFYWSWNPNSGDTGGVLLDDWKTLDAAKVTLLTRLITANKGGSSASSASSVSSSKSSASSSSKASSSSSASSASSSSSSKASSSSSSSKSSSSSSKSSSSSSSSAGGGTGSAPVFSYQINSDWTTGFCAVITVSNPGNTALSGWSGTLNVGTAKVTQLWNANWSQAGSVLSLSAMPYNMDIPAKSSTGAGFCANR